MRSCSLVILCVALLPGVAAACSDSLEPNQTPPPADTTDPNPPPAAPLDGRGGGVLAFTHQPGTDDGVHVIHAMNADGSGRTRLSNAPFGINHHQWSPDAHQLAAVGYRNGYDTWSIHVFDYDGTNLTRLTDTRDVWDTEPSWSPDGTKIAFTRMLPNQNRRSELWLMNADGTDLHWIGLLGFAAKWSSDGTRFIYASGEYGGGSNIMSCNIDGTGVQTIYSTSATETTPEWSPDGGEIVFTSDADGDHEVYLMNSDGSNVRQLTHNTGDDYAPRWSSDGSLIAFVADDSGDEHWEVHVIDSDGSNLRRITTTRTPATSINPVWRPTFLGEERPFAEAIQFAPIVVGNNQSVHGSLTFSPVSNEVWWSAVLAGGTDETLFRSTFNGVDLGAASSLAHLTDLNDHGPAFAPAGDKIFFSSRKPFPDPDSDSLYGIWYLDRNGDSWSDPMPVVATLDPARTTGQVSIAANGNLYFTARLLSETEPHLYLSEFSGSVYQTPQLLTGTVGAETAVDPFVTLDERLLIFALPNKDDSHGLFDLYVSHKQQDGSWGVAVNLGGSVNTEHLERFPSFSADGKYLFFARGIGDQFPDPQTRFYWIPVREVEALRR